MEPTRVIAYLRVSTEEQATEGVSLAAQEAKLRAYCVALDLELVAIEVDAGVSAKTLARPGLQAALRTLRKGFADALLVAKLDRLTRSVRDLGDLLEGHFSAKGSGLIVVGESVDTRTASGRLLLNLLVSVSQWEREAIGERTSTALQHMKTQGLRVGAIPYGSRLVGDLLEPDPSEQKLIARARALRAEGLTLRAISAALAREGMLSRKGIPMLASQVARVLSA